MRKISLFFAACLPFFVAVPAFAAEQINAFDVKATLTADRRLTLSETIKYDFGENERHGIYRIIPDVYDRNGVKYRLHLQFDEATVDGQSTPWSESSQSDGEEIKIGDADKTLTGIHTYRLTYETDKAINDFATSTELYWNVTGNGWTVPVASASFTLDAPGTAERAICYTGYLGSPSSECLIKIAGSRVTASTERVLDVNEGMTVVIGFPPGVIHPLSTSQKVWQLVMDNSWLFFPVLVLFGMFGIWVKWGKEPRGRGTIIAQYESPRDLRPAMMAALREQRVSPRAITATILDLARQGHLKIRWSGDVQSKGWFAKKPTFTLVKMRETEGTTPAFEQEIFSGLFAGKTEVSPGDLKGTFWQTIESARKEIFDELRAQKLFGANPAVVRAAWLGFAAAFAVGGFFFMDVFGPAFIVSAIVCGLIVAGFGWQMPRMTKEGAIALEEIEGFKKFLSVTEKDRLAFTDAPERTPEQFEAFLPAAIAFGVEEKWAAQFAGIDMRPPSYMEGNAGAWNAMVFANSLTGFHQVSAAGMYAPPRSTAGGGGSGFSGGGSGGGFGGGGGGSW